MERPELIAALRRGTLLVAPCPAVRPGWRAWVSVAGAGIRDIRPGWRNPELTLHWQVREWDPVYLADDLCWAEDDGMRALERHTSTGEEQLWTTVERFGGCTAFTYPWYTEFPG
ncbi:hypothetical protein GCM10022225_29800 [Plantactinospora mayteni]|uniref:Uncharacterized protein n=1 Tax=Plantactinospora mayteni TaxID=566021 RepID=A0ABQ4ESW7_9ACTN|nr:hypothetical protein [Plantactinospora mayteni]GIG97756.1 hypothetical protein Pma05_43290 [Plantactinospora mayteni]